MLGVGDCLKICNYNGRNTFCCLLSNCCCVMCRSIVWLGFEDLGCKVLSCSPAVGDRGLRRMGGATQRNSSCCEVHERVGWGMVAVFGILRRLPSRVVALTAVRG